MYIPGVGFRDELFFSSVYSRKTGMLSWLKHRGCRNKKEDVTKKK